ncbi:DUF397 domain-containing protein [Actinomadura xylanilytica]|uniref:DUF397 domain-containing protein n=1 Tax=Actinomadura xylanilytica TaxID=887459 RepID=UPI00255AB133|nr:DUF397 domain-containing protein [Actinomadura xylanilytica]MDL4770729.1 DUF397 domain-containing protein [Actinomadura xylanilytica]
MDLDPHEPAPTAWRKSSHSGQGDADCVEVAETGWHVAVRDSKAPQGAKLFLSRRQWSDLLTAIRSSTGSGEGR